MAIRGLETVGREQVCTTHLFEFGWFVMLLSFYGATRGGEPELSIPTFEALDGKA